MVQKEVHTGDSIVYYITHSSKDWNLKDNYFGIALFHLLNETPYKYDINKLRLGQEYQYVAKLIFDEVNKDKPEIKLNCKKIIELIKDYNTNREQKTGDMAITYLFYIVIMSLLKYNYHISNLNKEEISIFINLYKNPSNKPYSKLKRIVSLFYGFEYSQEHDESSDLIDLSLDILSDRLILSRDKTRNKEVLMRYYAKRTLLDNKELVSSSEKAKTDLLIVALLIKSSSGSGLYLPEIEKDSYLSRFANEIVKEKYLKKFDEVNSLKFNLFGKLDVKLPLWLVFAILFGLELCIFILPNIVSPLANIIGGDKFESLYNLLLNLQSLPLWLTILINGLIVGLLLYIQQKYIKKKIWLS